MASQNSEERHAQPAKKPVAADGKRRILGTSRHKPAASKMNGQRPNHGGIQAQQEKKTMRNRAVEGGGGGICAHCRGGRHCPAQHRRINLWTTGSASCLTLNDLAESRARRMQSIGWSTWTSACILKDSRKILRRRFLGAAFLTIFRPTITPSRTAAGGGAPGPPTKEGIAIKTSED